MVPIFKKGSRFKPENYRPVSLTVVISKMLEHIIVSQIMDHLDSQNILRTLRTFFMKTNMGSVLKDLVNPNCS